MTQPAFKMVVLGVLDRAKDNGEEFVIAACRRLLHAYTLGFRKHANRSDVELVRSFAEDLYVE